MIKAVIFDCFGVLVQGTLAAFYDRHNFTDEQKKEARALDDSACRGYIPYETYVGELAAVAGLPVGQVFRELDNNPPNEALLSYIRTTLKPHYRIGFLSNASDNWLDDLFTAEQQALFDDFVLSFPVHMAKPDERIFALAARNLGVLPEECIMVDDVERYCTGAKDAGMKAVHYASFTQFETDIRKLLD